MQSEGLNERIDESVLRWFGHVEWMEMAKRVYIGVCASSRSVVGHRRDGFIPCRSV